MNEDNLPKRDNIWRQTADQVAGVFPYFLVAYLIFLVISLFYDSLDKYLNLAGFTTAIIFLGVITFFSRYFQSGILSFFWSRIRLLWGLLLNYKYKIALIIIFTLLCAWGGASITELLVAVFGATSVLFMLDIRISGGLALCLLVLCPVFLLVHQDVVAEVMAVFAYYFLVIAVVSELVHLKNYPQLG